MFKVFAVVMLGFIVSGCSLNQLQVPEPAEGDNLIVVCPDGKVTLNTGTSTAECYDFMELEKR